MNRTLRVISVFVIVFSVVLLALLLAENLLLAGSLPTKTEPKEIPVKLL